MVLILILLQSEPSSNLPSLIERAPVNGTKPISAEQEELIHRLVYFQNEYEQPSEEDLKRISVSGNFFFSLLDFHFKNKKKVPISGFFREISDFS